jgi:hypothetical protein
MQKLKNGMKKFTLLALLFAFVCGFTASAQSFYMDKGDTSKAYWTAMGTDVLVYNKIYNKTTSPIKITWRVNNFHMDPGWSCGGICDNILCYGASEDLVTGAISKTTDNIAPKSFISDMHIIFNGDGAAIGTWSFATISFTDVASGDDTSATFAAYKNAVGGITVTRVEDNVTLFPNPAQNYIDVLYSASADVRTISLYNIIGKLVNVYKVSSNTSAHCEFNTEMPSGIYLMRLADSKGNIVATRKFTRQ